MNSRDSSPKVTICIRIGLFLLGAGHSSEALEEFQVTLDSEWSDFGDALPTLTERQTLFRAEKVVGRADLIYYAALKSPKSVAARAYRALLQTKALFSEVSRARQRMLVRSRQPGFRELRERYLESRRQLSRRTLDAEHLEVPTTPDELTKLAAEEHELELGLIRVPGGTQAGARLTPVPAEQVLSRLRFGEALLDYFTFNVDFEERGIEGRHYGAFVLKGGGRIEVVDLGAAAPIVSAIEAFRDCEARQTDPSRPMLDEDELAKLGAKLRALVLDPLVPRTAGVQRLYVAPAGMLGLIPFDALPSESTQAGWRYLAEDTEVVYLLTGRDLARAATGRSPSGEAWLFGDPDFDATPDQRIAALSAPFGADDTTMSQSEVSGAARPILMGGERKPDPSQTLIPTDWQRLQATRSVVSSAAQQAKKAGLDTRTLLGAGASEENFSRVQSARLLLFATHGYFMSEMAPVHFEGSFNANNKTSDQEGGAEHSVEVTLSIGHFNGTLSSFRQHTSSLAARAERSDQSEMVVDNEDFWETSNPLQRSMMTLAGANRRQHHVILDEIGGRLRPAGDPATPGVPRAKLGREVGDGLLTAYEVLGMDLGDTDLVVLAGCDSGVGVTPEKGSGITQESESVIGLKQAFTIAGARAVLTSMWEVPLDQTVEQMNSFLDTWLSQQHPRYQAFHESQLKALRSARANGLGGHPLWWAGFVYFGDPGDR
jgi:CHAT domain-containing protein